MLKTKRSIRILVCLSLACAMLVSLFGFSIPTASAQVIKEEPIYTVDCYTANVLKNVGNGKVMTEKSSGKVESWSFDSKNGCQFWLFQCTTDGYFKIINSSGKYLTSPVNGGNKEKVTMEAAVATNAESRQLWKITEHFNSNGNFTYYTFQAKNRKGSSLYLAAEKIIFNINGGYIWQESISSDWVKWTMEAKAAPNSSQSY